MLDLFKDGVGRDWRQVLKTAGIADAQLTRQGLWDLMNPTEFVCSCGKERPVRLTNIGRLLTCGADECRNKLKAAKTRATSLMRYGTERPAQSAEVKAVQAATFKARYNGHPTKDAAVQTKRLRTNLARYGTATPAIEPSRLAESIKKRKETEHMKYLKDVWPHRVSYFKDHLSIDVLSPFISTTSDLTCKHLTCGTIWTAVPRPIPCCPVCTSSREQQGIETFIATFGLPYERNTRKIITPYEIDLYIPSLKIGVELNGAYWHREGAGTPIALKTELATSTGIRIMHVSDSDWNLHADIVKSHIRHMLGRTEVNIAARKCEVKFISRDISQAFLAQTHLQGSANAKHHIGLFYGSALVAVMTLGKPRWGSTIGLELIRWSTALNTNVRGGFTKVLSFVQAEVKPERIISYCDLRTGTGSVYKAAGFKFKGNTNPGYVWGRGRTIMARQNTQKHKLPSLLGEKYNPDLSERANMEAAGWSRIFDAGHQRWELT